MFDEQMEQAGSISAPVPKTQISVAELFYSMTLVAVCVGVFIYVSEALTIFVGGVMVVVGVTRVWPSMNPIAGAVRGFVAASVIGWVLFMLGYGDYFLRLSLIIFLPPLGYILGFTHSELSRDST